MSCCGSVAIENRDQSDSSGPDSCSRGGESTGSIACLILAGFIAGNSTLFAVVANVSELSPQLRFTFNTALMTATVLVAALLSPQLYQGIKASISKRQLSLETLFVFGCLGASGISLQSWWNNSGPIYFEVVSILLVIYTIGSRMKRQVQQSVLRSLEHWSPNRQECRVLDSQNRIQYRFVAEVVVGDRAVVAAGKMIPIDGVIEAGSAFIQEATITGEPNLRSCHPGDTVFASSVVVDSQLVIKATKPGDNRQIDRISAVIQQAEMSPSRWQSQAERISRIFTPTVALLCLAIFLGWYFYSGISAAILCSLSAMLVACPCAFGFATPVSIWVAIGRLASHSIVVRRADSIERLAAIDTVVFDKTGTLTKIRPSIRNLFLRNSVDFPESLLLSLAASLEATSHHPLAIPFQQSKNASLWPVAEMQLLPGVGLCGIVKTHDGDFRVEIGKLERLVSDSDHDWLGSIPTVDPLQEMSLAIRVNEALVGVAVIEESVIDSLEEGLAGIAKLGISVQLFSGDSGPRVKKIGIAETNERLSPDQKLARVKDLLSRGRHILYVGDGINDAASMAVADVSMAVSTGSDSVKKLADLLWYDSDLRSVVATIAICRATVKRLRLTLIFALFYNCLGITVAALGFLHPIVAVLLMMGSSLFVVLRAASNGYKDDSKDGSEYGTFVPKLLTEFRPVPKPAAIPLQVFQISNLPRVTSSREECLADGDTDIPSTRSAANH